MKPFYTLDEESREILRTSYSEEIKKTEINVFSHSDAAAIFNISEEDLQFKINRIESISKREAFKKGYNKCFIDDEINIIGMYLLCYYNQESDNTFFKKYLELFSEQSILFSVKLLGNLLSDKTERRYAQSGKISEEEYFDILATKEARSIDSSLKVMKEDVENTEHIFYRKKVVITGLFDAYPERNEIAALLHNVGADVNGAISGKTDFVIVGREAGPKKLEKIAELNISVIDEMKLLEIFPR